MKTKDSETDDLLLGEASCPVCGQETAIELGGSWLCADGCDLSEWSQCPKCGEFFKGSAGYCRDCIHDV